jgi:hypothetical protein
MAQGNYMSQQDPGFHGMPGQMGQRMGYPMLRLPARPGGPVPAQPNNLRLQLQHRLQGQLVGQHTIPGALTVNNIGPILMNFFICKETFKKLEIMFEMINALQSLQIRPKAQYANLPLSKSDTPPLEPSM